MTIWNARFRLSFSGLALFSALVSLPAQAGIFDVIKSVLGSSPSPSATQAVGPSINEKDRPFRYVGPARPKGLKQDQYLSIWPADSGAEPKIYTLDITGKRDDYSHRSWTDLDVNNFSGKPEISTLPVVQIPMSQGGVHKVMAYIQPQYSQEFVMAIRVKDEAEFRDAAKFLQGVLPFDLSLTFMKSGSQYGSWSHTATIGIEKKAEGYVDLPQVRNSIENLFPTSGHSLLKFMTPPNEGEHFLVATINLRQYEGQSLHDVQTKIFRALAPYDLIFAYQSSISNALDRGDQLAEIDRTVEFVPFGMNKPTRVAVHGNFRELNQRAQLSPSASKDLNRQYDHYQLGSIRLPDGHERPMGFEIGWGTVMTFKVRCANAAEAATLAMTIGNAKVFPVSQLDHYSRMIFELAQFEPNEHIVSFQISQENPTETNRFLTADRLKSDALVFMAKNLGLRFVGAEYMQASLEQFDRMLQRPETHSPIQQITSETNTGLGCDAHVKK